MKMNYEKNYYVVKAEEIEANYDAGGFAKTELLSGVYDGGIRSYKCFLKAGAAVTPELYADKTVVIFFGKGCGELEDCDGVHKITELSFYVPFMDQEGYEIRAGEDMEFIFNVVEMNEWDLAEFGRWHIKLPYFRRHSECVQYIQDCKGANTEARMILCTGWIGRIILGTTRAHGEGTVEKGHPSVHQWNYCVGNSDFSMSVGYKEKNEMETINHKAGDWSFIPAGADHDLVSEPGKEVFYVWFEHFTDEEKFKEEEG